MPKIELKNVTKRWGGFYAVENLNLSIDDASFVTLLGPSGCGKTTTLRMIAGLETPTSGRIEIGDTVVFDSDLGINIPPNKRKVGFLFQNYALWPNMTVYDNIAFGLSNIKGEMAKVDFEARNAAKLIDILSNPADVVRQIEDCRNKKGALDQKKAYIKLIDAYTISMFTAKELYKYDLQSSKDPAKLAADITAKLAAVVDGRKAAAKAKGMELNAAFGTTGKQTGFNQFRRVGGVVTALEGNGVDLPDIAFVAKRIDVTILDLAMLTGAVDGLRLRLTGNGLAVFVAAFHAALEAFRRCRGNRLGNRLVVEEILLGL